MDTEKNDKLCKGYTPENYNMEPENAPEWKRRNLSTNH